MDKLEYQGKTYYRRNSKWADAQGAVAHEYLQRTLNDLYIEATDPFDLHVEELIAQGDKFKESSSYAHAIRYYEHAVSRAENASTVAGVLPRLTSCYRMLKQPQKAIEVLSAAKASYGVELISEALLTSAAAAYCDLGQYENARKCCNRAYAISDGKPGSELRAVYGRIRKETE